MRLRAKINAIVLAASLLILAGCGGGSVGGGPPPPPPITVSVSPTTASVVTNATQKFSAAVSNDSNNAGVTWDVGGVQGGNTTLGTISTDGNYIAPANVPNPAVVKVAAISKADPTKSASASVTVTAPVITISITPTSAALNFGQTQQFGATVTGTSNTSVTWTSTGGTVSGSGLYTASNGAGNSFSVTATSVADTSKSASATITISAPPGPAISGVSAFSVPCNGECFGNKIVITGSNFTSTDLVHLSPALSGGSGVTLVSSTEIDLFAGWDSPAYYPGQFTVFVSRSDGSNPSNSWKFGLKDNRNWLGRNANGHFYTLEVLSDQGTVHQYAADGSHVADFPVSGGARAIAVDAQTGTVVIAQRAGGALVTYDQNGTQVNGDGNAAAGETVVDAANGVACAGRGNVLDCLDLTNPNATAVSTAAGVVNSVCGVAVGPIGAELDAFVRSCGNGQVVRINTATMKVSGTPLQLAGVSNEASLTARGQLILFATENRLAFLDPTDSQVVFIDATAMTVQKTVALTGTVYGAFGDQASGKLVVVYNPDVAGQSGSQAVPVKLLAVDVVSGATMSLTNPQADILPTGGCVSMDGKSIALSERGRLVLTPNQ